jgi:hypothetical protein
MAPIPNGKSAEELEISPELRSIVNRVVNWEELEINHFIRQVEIGRKGMNAGWGNGFHKINAHIHGTHCGRYYLLGADSGVGKTTVADFAYLLEQYEYAKAHKKKWHCFYYSFELAKVEKIARWVSYYIATKYNRVYPSNFILGRIHKNVATDEDMQYIRLGYAYVSEMMTHMTIVEDPVHPTKIFLDLKEYYRKNGTMVEEKPVGDKKHGRILSYTPGPGIADAMIEVFIDHIGLTHSESGLDTKGTIDLLSKYAVASRNLFATTWVILQQFSTDMQSWHRSAKKITDKFIAPQRLDFGDSKYTFRDADVVMGLIAPHQFDLDTYFGYSVDKLQGYMLGLHIMKNRYGTSSVMMPVFMNPLCGVLEELPPSGDAFLMEEYYEKTEEILKLCLNFSPRV